MRTKSEWADLIRRHAGYVADLVLGTVDSPHTYVGSHLATALDTERRNVRYCIAQWRRAAA